MEIWVRWEHDGSVEQVDCFDSESEALVNLEEYRMAYGSSITSIWLQG